MEQAKEDRVPLESIPVQAGGTHPGRPMDRTFVPGANPAGHKLNALGPLPTSDAYDAETRPPLAPLSTDNILSTSK